MDAEPFSFQSLLFEIQQRTQAHHNSVLLGSDSHQAIASKPVDVMPLIRTQCSHCLWLNFMSLLDEFIKNAAHIKDVVEDQTVCNQMIVLEELALLLPIVSRDDTVTTKG